MQEFKPTADHQWLTKFAGEWTLESEADMGPGQPKVKSTGRESGRMLGENWAIVEGGGAMSGGPQCQWLMSVGFDPLTGRYVGSWIGTMMGHQFVYDGIRDGETLTLECDGPSFVDPTKTARYRDVYTFVTDDHRTLRSGVRNDDGTWTEFMHADYRRK